jgi:hypothetical protein
MTSEIIAQAMSDSQTTIRPFDMRRFWMRPELKINGEQ